MTMSIDDVFFLALQSPIAYQKEQSQATALRKTNSQPASMMMSNLSHSPYTRMTSVPYPPVNRVRSSEAGGEGSVETAKGQEVKGEEGSSVDQGNVSRLSKSASAEDRCTAVTDDTSNCDDGGQHCRTIPPGGGGGGGALSTCSTR